MFCKLKLERHPKVPGYVSNSSQAPPARHPPARGASLFDCFPLVVRAGTGRRPASRIFLKPQLLARNPREHTMETKIASSMSNQQENIYRRLYYRSFLRTSYRSTLKNQRQVLVA